MVSAKKLLVASLCLSAQSAFALGAGDVAFTAFNADEDGWALVTLTDLAAHSTLYFTDSNWDGAAFTSAEGFHAWDTGDTGIAAGTVVRFSRIDQASRTVSLGTLASSGNAALSSTGDTLFAYLGTSASLPTSFLAAVSSENGTSIAAAGLTLGLNAILLPASTDYSEYVGARSGATDFLAYGAQVNDAANWAGFTDGSHADATPDLGAFTVSAVPEVSSYWMMLAGLALIARRRRS